MTQQVGIPRYSGEDLETASIRSGAPSYVSEAPSYHSNRSIPEAIPAYTPRTVPSFSSISQPQQQAPAPSRTIGLPPIPNTPRSSIPSLHSYRLPTWSANNSLASRHYHNVAARRVIDGRYQDIGRRSPERQRPAVDAASSAGTSSSSEELRPLEDPYLVGEVAAATARRERLARETGEDILIQEDRRWDFMLTQMRDWDERDKSWTQFKREVEFRHRKTLLRRIGGSRYNGFMS